MQEDESLPAGRAALGAAAAVHADPSVRSGGMDPQGLWSRCRSTVAGRVGRTVQLGLPMIKDGAAHFGNWLAHIGWGRFFLLSLLLFILALIFGQILQTYVSPATPSGDRGDHGSITVAVNVLPLQDGRLLIAAADPTTARSSVASVRPAEPGSGAPHAGKKDNFLEIAGDHPADPPALRIDDQGIRFLAEDHGRRVMVVIDHEGVRIDQPAASAPANAAAAAKAVAADAAVATGAAPPTTGAAPLLLPLPKDPADSDKFADTVEAARDQIEHIVQDQVDRKLAALDKADQQERDHWIVTLTTLVVVALIALKLVLGSKTRAELQARRAGATAAQEGLKRQLAEAQLKMMQAQVEPHFLFNTLASVDYLIETDPARASRMQKNLIQYLRAALPQMRAGSSRLEREIAQCRSYLEILKVRMEERLQFSINVPQGLLSANFPPMMLLTLVENAIKHGLEPKAEGGSLALSASIADANLRVAVADSGMGFGQSPRSGTGVGLANVRERLRALYGPAASLVVEANADGGTIATIVLPYRVNAATAESAALAEPAATS